MNPMSLVTLPPALLRASFEREAEVPHGERGERSLAMAVGLVGLMAALVIVFA